MAKTRTNLTLSAALYCAVLHGYVSQFHFRSFTECMFRDANIFTALGSDGSIVFSVVAIVYLLIMGQRSQVVL